MRYLFVLLLLGRLSLSAQNSDGSESGFVALTAFKTLVENKLTLFNDMLRQENGKSNMYSVYLDVQNEYGKMDIAYSVFKERLINCIRNNAHKKKALDCIGSKAINIDSLSKGFLSKIDVALNGNTNNSATAGSAKNRSTALSPLTARAAIDMVDYMFSLIAKAKDNRQKQLDILQAELLSDRYKLKSFGFIVKYRAGRE
jgi:hypothetical protein